MKYFFLSRCRCSADHEQIHVRVGPPLRHTQPIKPIEPTGPIESVILDRKDHCALTDWLDAHSAIGLF